MNNAKKSADRKPGRPPGRVILRSEYGAALYVQRRQHEWREKNDRERVPAELTEEWLNEAIGLMRQKFPEEKVSLEADDIRNRLLKRVYRVFLLGERRRSRRTARPK